MARMENGAGARGFRPSSFESNPSVKSVKSVVKTISENCQEIEFARTANQWSMTGEGSKKSTQDAMTLKVGNAETQREGRYES
jgi:hypothetical protein